MSPPAYTLHAPPGSHRAFKALIAAEYNGIDVKVAEPFDAARVKAMSPTGRGPVLEITSASMPGGGAVIFESNAIARHLSKVRRDAGLTGQSLLEEAEIDAWVDFCSNEVDLPASVWFYPVAGFMPFSEAAYNKAKTDLGSALTILNTQLLTKTYLVGHQITLADIAVVSALIYPFKLLCDKTYLKPYGNVVRWFDTCVAQPQFKAVIGDVTMCKTELRAPGQKTVSSAVPGGGKDKGKGKGGNRGGGGKTKDKKRGDNAAAPPAPAPASAPAPAPAPKKVEHPYRIMDREHPSQFSMDAWKKTYSNAKSYDEAMATFWSTYDREGWSIWLQEYNHNEDNKRIFMVSNAISGFQQRSDLIRRWAFGVMDILGTEETSLEICGIWLLRGDSTDHMKRANDDANWYTWTKLAGKGLEPTDEVKARVAAYWCSENELEGKPIQDSKVFK